MSEQIAYEMARATKGEITVYHKEYPPSLIEIYLMIACHKMPNMELENRLVEVLDSLLNIINDLNQELKHVSDK